MKEARCFCPECNTRDRLEVEHFPWQAEPSADESGRRARCGCGWGGFTSELIYREPTPAPATT